MSSKSHIEIVLLPTIFIIRMVLLLLLYILISRKLVLQNNTFLLDYITTVQNNFSQQNTRIIFK